ncbi:MAG: GNAT family N-acetyltransferase [Paramuribaculum sp.]|nr:GNAT family N-acetyltransferase [Paramuribaculum sp.]
MNIREGQLNDAARIAEIYNYYVRTSPVIFSNRQLSGTEMEQKLQRLEVGSRFPFLVATDDTGIVIGYCYAHLWQPDPVYNHTWELTLYLDHESKGQGIGSALLRNVIDLCSKAGAHTLISCVSEGNTACERMCTNAGFSLVGRIPEVGYKFDRYYNDLIYQLIFP